MCKSHTPQKPVLFRCWRCDTGHLSPVTCPGASTATPPISCLTLCNLSSPVSLLGTLSPRRAIQMIDCMLRQQVCIGLVLSLRSTNDSRDTPQWWRPQGGSLKLSLTHCRRWSLLLNTLFYTLPGTGSTHTITGNVTWWILNTFLLWTFTESTKGSIAGSMLNALWVTYLWYVPQFRKDQFLAL